MAIALQFIKENVTGIIIICGIALFVLIMINGSKLSQHKSRIDEAVSRRNKKYGLNPSDGTVIDEDDEDAAITPDTIRKFERDFNKTCALHSVLSQLIPIFPLMGILGTVAGLMLESQAVDIEGMMGSIDVALDSTLWGLGFTILLKIADTVFPSRIIEDVDILLDDYSKKLDLADMIQKIKSNV